jgi:hypothetical protein
MLRTITFALLVATFAFAASAQTTQPSKPLALAPDAPSQAWPRTVELLAKALAKGDSAEAESLMSSRVMVRALDSSATMEIAALLRRVEKSTLVGQHGYTQSPMVMAADIAADFKNAASIDEKSKARFLIDDDNDMKRANSTAAQWAAEQLGATNGTPTGVIVLWTPRPAPLGTVTSDSPQYDAVFVLCRGEEVAPNEFKITMITFGNPAPQTNP